MCSVSPGRGSGRGLKGSSMDMESSVPRLHRRAWDSLPCPYDGSAGCLFRPALPLGRTPAARYPSPMAKKNPLKLNALKLRTLPILQQMARHPHPAQPGGEECVVLVTNCPTAHGNHVHVGDAVGLARDAGGRGNPNGLASLGRKGLLRSRHPMGALLTAEALAYDTGLADQVLHRPDQ